MSSKNVHESFQNVFKILAEIAILRKSFLCFAPKCSWNKISMFQFYFFLFKECQIVRIQKTRSSRRLLALLHELKRQLMAVVKRVKCGQKFRKEQKTGQRFIRFIWINSGPDNRSVSNFSSILALIQGRRIGKEDAVENPTFYEIKEILEHEGFKVFVENKVSNEF